MELSRHHRTASLNFGALLSKGSLMPLTRDAAIAMAGVTSSTEAVGKLSGKTAGVQPALEQEQSPVSNDIDATLVERGSRYGSFVGHSEITQNIKYAMKRGSKWESLDNDQKEALEMIAHKIGRILNGDPNYHDSWHDIVGYTKLVADRLVK